MASSFSEVDKDLGRAPTERGKRAGAPRRNAGRAGGRDRDRDRSARLRFQPQAAIPQGALEKRTRKTATGEREDHEKIIEVMKKIGSHEINNENLMEVMKKVRKSFVCGAGWGGVG